MLLRELLAEAAERVEFACCCGRARRCPLFAPAARLVREARDELMRGTRIKAALDSHERPMHCHHEKLVVVDDEVAFVGGIDLTDLGGDRYDTPDASGARAARLARRRLAPARARRSPTSRDHFAQRWHAVTGERLERRRRRWRRAGDIELQIVRTVPEKVYDFAPRGDFRILEAYMRALRSAAAAVYLENQFLWSPEIVDILAGKLRQPPTDEFRVVVVLPAQARTTGRTTPAASSRVLADADGGAGRFLATTIRARTATRSDRVYVHAKVGIVDDRWLTLGSANLNAHSFFNDTEVNVVTCDPALARDTRLRLWAEHLERDVEPRSPATRRRRRRALAPDRGRAARAPAARRAADPPPDRAAGARAAPSACSARSTRWSSTADPARRAPTPRPRRARAARRGRRSGATSRCSSSSAARPGGRPCG